MKNIIKNLVVVAIIFIITGCNSNARVSVDDDIINSEYENENQLMNNEILVSHLMGETTVAINPERVVVFDYGTLDTLDLLGINVVGIPKSNVPNYLSRYRDDESVVNVGTQHEPNFETVNELEPGLIIISGRQRDSYDELSKIAPTIYLGIDNSNYLQSFKQNAIIIGEIFGKQDEVLGKLEAIDTRIEVISDLVADKQANALIALYNQGSFSAYGSGSRFGIIHDVLGFLQADENIEVSTHGMSVTNEYILEKNPDYLFIVDRNSLSSNTREIAKNEIENELIQMTNAYQNGNIVYLPIEHWYISGGGLMSVDLMLDDIQDALR